MVCSIISGLDHSLFIHKDISSFHRALRLLFHLIL